MSFIATLTSAIVLGLEDVADLSVRRLEHLDDLDQELHEPTPLTLDIEAMVAELVELNEAREDAKRRKDWDVFWQRSDEFSALCQGNPAYGKFKALRDGHAHHEFVTDMPEDKPGLNYKSKHTHEQLGEWVEVHETGMEIETPCVWDSLRDAHIAEQRLFELAESERGAWPFFQPTAWFAKRKAFFEALSTVQELKAELADLREKKDLALRWMHKAKDVHTFEERKTAIKARYLELGLRKIEVVKDELADAQSYLETCRAKAEMPSIHEYYRRKRAVEAYRHAHRRPNSGRAVPAPVVF